MNYEDFIRSKIRHVENLGFENKMNMPELFDFQKHIVNWNLLKGRSATFADCGLGKTPMQLYWSQSIIEKTNKNILILTPLAVADQTVKEGIKFGIKAHKSHGEVFNGITVTNYEKLHLFKPDDFIGVVCDESSILKNYAGKTRQAITDFLQNIPYRLLCTATPAPNDFMELGTSSEALSIMKRVEMLATYFIHDSGTTQKWRLKGHAEEPFWKFMSSWSRAIRRPSDLGFDDEKFILPKLITEQHTVKSNPREGELFVSEALTLNEQRAERKATLESRCDKVAEIANSHNKPFLSWCSLNDESKLLAKKINGAVELSGSDTESEKERKMLAFSDGSIRCLVTKPKIAGFGMNWQHCGDMSFFPSHSHEQYYQAIRRCYRFGRKGDVEVNIVTSEAERSVLNNMQRKEKDSDLMFEKIIKMMSKHYKLEKANYKTNQKMEVPKWLNA